MYQSEKIYPVKISVIRGEIVDMVLACRHKLKRIREQRPILLRDEERITQESQGIEDNEVVLLQYFSDHGVLSSFKISGVFLT